MHSVTVPAQTKTELVPLKRPCSGTQQLPFLYSIDKPYHHFDEWKVWTCWRKDRYSLPGDVMYVPK